MTNSPYGDITPAQDPDEAKPDALTAFLVVVRPDGSAFATPELDTELTVDHTASLEEMLRALREVESDITTAKTAQNVVMLMAQQAQAMAHAQSMAQQGRAPSGLHVPGT